MINSTPERVETPPTTDFHKSVSDALDALRSSIADMFAIMPGGVRKSHDVSKLLGVDSRLSWQVFKLTGSGDAMALAPHVPLPAAMRRLLNAAANYGVTQSRVDGVREAFDSFERLVALHAGDRATFDTMTRALSDDDESFQQADIDHRKAIFKGNRYLFANELDTHITTSFNFPTATPGHVDVGSMRSKLGIRRHRADAELVVEGSRVFNVGDKGDSIVRSPVDPEAAQKYGAQLIPQFCTQPVPPLVSNDYKGAAGSITLGGDSLGRLGAVDLVFGSVWRNVELFSTGSDGKRGFDVNIYVTVPTIRCYVDVLVPRLEFAWLQPTVESFGFVPVFGDLTEIRRTKPPIPFREQIVRLAGGVNGAQIREVPDYLRMLKTFCENMNWSIDEFEVFRFSIEYPLMGSLISLRFVSAR